MRSYKISHRKNILGLTISFGFLSQMPFTTVSIVWKSNDQVTHLPGINDLSVDFGQYKHIWVTFFFLFFLQFETTD